MDEILHHPRNPGMMIPLQIPTNNGFSWFQSGAGFRPSTVCLPSYQISALAGACQGLTSVPATHRSRIRQSFKASARLAKTIWRGVPHQTSYIYMYIWVKVKPPGGLQVLVYYVTTYLQFWVPIFDPQPYVCPWKNLPEKERNHTKGSLFLGENLPGKRRHTHTAKMEY